jgi:hypothetical protein
LDFLSFLMESAQSNALKHERCFPSYSFNKKEARNGMTYAKHE